MKTNRDHPAFWAAIVHRLSGLALGAFLPLHFLALGTALSGAAGLDRLPSLTAGTEPAPVRGPRRRATRRASPT